TTSRPATPASAANAATTPAATPAAPRFRRCRRSRNENRRHAGNADKVHANHRRRREDAGDDAASRVRTTLSHQESLPFLVKHCLRAEPNIATSIVAIVRQLVPAPGQSVLAIAITDSII